MLNRTVYYNKLLGEFGDKWPSNLLHSIMYLKCVTGYKDSSNLNGYWVVQFPNSLPVYKGRVAFCTLRLFDENFKPTIWSKYFILVDELEYESVDLRLPDKVGR